MIQVNITSENELQWIENLAEWNLLKKMLSSFSKSTGLKAIIVDTQGNTLINSTDHEIKDSNFCRKIREDNIGIKKCTRSYARACTEADKYGEPYIFRCHAGLLMWAVPIVLNEYSFSIICKSVDSFAVKWASTQLEIMSSDKLQAAADLLFIMSNQILKNGTKVLTQSRDCTDQQARLAEEIQACERPKVAMRIIESRAVSINSLDKEYELKTMVRNGEKRAAQQLLEQLLSDITEVKHEHFDAFKTRVMELVIIISRAAVNRGADLNVILQHNFLFYKELLEITTPEEICARTKDMLENYMNLPDLRKYQRNFKAIQKAAEFVRINYRKKITIEDIAQAVYLSPCYISRIFKQNLGCTISEYITQVRLENAKLMLKNCQYNIIQVAKKNGFEDPTYFARVFKKIEGIAPSRYRQYTL
ncbi:MAG TPA: AraC family transcriptional regulator [Desulfosporosinus sp.]|nr:AraC family transcriptional regulator [Desulfosporosinus sp.]